MRFNCALHVQANWLILKMWDLFYVVLCVNCETFYTHGAHTHTNVWYYFVYIARIAVNCVYIHYNISRSLLCCAATAIYLQHSLLRDSHFPYIHTIHTLHDMPLRVCSHSDFNLCVNTIACIIVNKGRCNICKLIVTISIVDVYQILHDLE